MGWKSKNEWGEYVDFPAISFTQFLVMTLETQFTTTFHKKEIQKISPSVTTSPTGKKMPLEDKLDTAKLTQAIYLARRYSVQNEYDFVQVHFSFFDFGRIMGERVWRRCAAFMMMAQLLLMICLPS
jgi:hypothetical protein